MFGMLLGSFSADRRSIKWREILPKSVENIATTSFIKFPENFRRYLGTFSKYYGWCLSVCPKDGVSWLYGSSLSLKMLFSALTVRKLSIPWMLSSYLPIVQSMPKNIWTAGLTYGMNGVSSVWRADWSEYLSALTMQLVDKKIIVCQLHKHRMCGLNWQWNSDQAEYGRVQCDEKAFCRNCTQGDGCGILAGRDECIWYQDLIVQLTDFWGRYL